MTLIRPQHVYLPPGFMQQVPEILSLAYKQVPMQEQLNLLQEKKQSMPGSVQYNIRRYQHNPQWATEDVGMLVYHYEKNDPADNYLELRFCVTGNMYCREKDTECSMCKSGFFINCADKVNSVDVFSF